MDILIGLLIIAIGSFCQSSSYVPIKKVKEWSWESYICAIFNDNYLGEYSEGDVLVHTCM